jgi:ribosome recycling factor
MIQNLVKDAEKKMNACIDHLHLEMGKLRTGRASLAILEGIKADYYGTPTPLSQLATLGVPDSHTITIQPWDASALSAVEKAIQTSDIGLNPVNDGKLIRLNVPQLTTERRQQLVKVLKKQGEDCKVALRTVRREFNDHLKTMEKEHATSKDELKKGHDEIQKIIDKKVEEVDKTVQKKETDLMTA